MQDRPIVVGVDGTTIALRAVAWAAREARLRQRPLRLVHAAPYLVIPDDPDGPTAGRHAMVRAVLGSVSRFVLRHSLVPVTVVPRSLTAAEGSTVSANVAGDPHDRSQLW
jgi:nucleotide-binding universal stress UspA family protein